MPLSHYFHIQYSVIIEINVSIFFLAQQGFLENVGKLSPFSFLPIGLLIQVFSFLLFLMFNLWKLAVKKEGEKKKVCSARILQSWILTGNSSKCYSNRVDFSSSLEWAWPWSGGYFIPSRVSLGDGGVIPDRLCNECFAFKKFIAVDTVNF